MKTLHILTVAILIMGMAGCSDDKSTSPKTVTVEAEFTVSPAAGTVITEFGFDAGTSTTNGESLEFRWDWDNDGVWDTPWSSSAAITHRYSLYEGSGLDTVGVTLEAKSGSATDTTFGEVVVDARHGLVLETVVTEAPGSSAMGSDGTHLWLADWGAPGTGRIYKVDPTSGDTLYSIPSPDLWPCGVTWDGSHLWISGAERVREVDPITGEVLDDFTVIYSRYAAGLAWDGQIFYHGSGGETGGADGRIHKYSPDGTHLGAFDSPNGDPSLGGLAFDGAHLWVAMRYDDSLYVVQPDDGTVLRAVYVQGRAGDVTVLGDYVWTRSGGPPARVVP